jgi:pimeloyl-ACP methyl ester carboxylesterase
MKVLPTLAIVMAMATPLFASAAEPAGAKNIVLVHGAFVDGSGWRGVHDTLALKGYKVTVVQQGLTTLEGDVAATREAVERQDGPVVLVGHSYGGSVITVAGALPKVKALVYVAAFEPDVGESVAQLAATMPAASDSVRPTADNRLLFDPAKFGADFAGDLPPNRTNFLAIAQVLPSAAVFGAKTTAAAWRDKPSYAIVASNDRALNPDLQRWMYKRAGAKVTEIKASHAVYISQPEAVAAVIEEAALNVKK